MGTVGQFGRCGLGGMVDRSWLGPSLDHGGFGLALAAHDPLGTLQWDSDPGGLAAGGTGYGQELGCTLDSQGDRPIRGHYCETTREHGVSNLPSPWVENRLDRRRRNPYFSTINVSFAFSKCLSRPGRSNLGRGCLSRLTDNFDKNPRLETVVGFFAPATVKGQTRIML